MLISVLASGSDLPAGPGTPLIVPMPIIGGLTAGLGVSLGSFLNPF